MFKGEWRVRRIVGGFLFILMLAVCVFLVLTRFLSSETREDVSTIAQTYLEGVSREEQAAFNAMADFSYSQPLNLKKQLETLAPSDAATVRYTLSEAARLQALTACALIDAEGAVESAYGAQIVSIDDRETLLERLMSGENAVASGHSMTDQLIL